MSLIAEHLLGIFKNVFLKYHIIGRKKKKNDAWSSTSLYSCVKSHVRDRVSGEVEKGSFITLPGRHGGPRWTQALKTMCPLLGKIVRSFVLTVQRGYDQLLLMVCGEINRGSMLSAFRSHWPGVYMLVGSIPLLIVNFSQLKGISVSVK